MTDKYDSQRLREIGSRIESNVRKDWGLEIIEAAMEIESKAAEIVRLRVVLHDLVWGVGLEMSPEWECSGYHPKLVKALSIARAALSGEPT